MPPPAREPRRGGTTRRFVRLICGMVLATLRWTCASVIVAGLLLFIATRPALCAPPDLRSQVRAEIQRLSDASRPTRVQAEQALLELGTDILPLLPPPDLLKSPSARQSIRRVRVRLEHDVAEQSLQPSTVTLNGEYTTAEFVKEIEKQTGNTISMTLLSPSHLQQPDKLSFTNTSFWKAISHLEANGLLFGFEKETGLLTLRPRDSKVLERVSVIDRAFRIDASAFTPRPVSDAEGILLSNQVRILCEPRLRPLFLKYQTSDFQISTSDSKSIIEAFNSGASIEIPLGNGGREAALSLSFLSKDVPAEQVSLHGKVNLLLAASEQPISFRELGRAKRVSRRRGGVTVTVNKVGFEGSRPQHHNARIQLRVSYDLGANAFESHQTWVFHNRVYLVDPDGKKHGPNGGFTTLHQGDGSVGVEYRFEDLSTDPANWEFVYVAPTLLINVEIPIALRDIPIARTISVQK
jgi:hypothetical protein